MTPDKRGTTSACAAIWEFAMPLLEAMYKEFKELSRKKPEGAVGTAKIVVVNRLLTKCRQVLEREESLPFVDLLNEDDVPQNSDVVLALSQYVAAMTRFRDRYFGWNGTEHTWRIGTT